MEKSTATKLATDLRQLDEVSSAKVVHFDEDGGTAFAPPEEHGTPDDNLYGVDYYAYDALIPRSVIDTVTEYDTRGIYIHPDPGVIVP